MKKGSIVSKAGYYLGGGGKVADIGLSLKYIFYEMRNWSVEDGEVSAKVSFSNLLLNENMNKIHNIY